ncbi:hypothetical protein CPJ18_22140 [Agrobacterium rosae]|uniref:Uncharacterized protein n=2 Tax=Agrobacterium rosae TaxID=1972867 RepID=A0AAE5RTS9_9HYPH|nr:hypothetical protein DXM21_14315 [Agrobacterium rosae]KAA3518962.1 hypothetical protein DXM25_13700 [Agrobacterium rosae]MQB49311.1 hypothetical protein [Agrobacterium rosae]POO49152.1 hypothetical protein CPJ18_22140 [Agrobacterium rosae]
MAGVFDFLLKKKTNGEDDLKAVLSPEEAKKQNFLSQFLPDDPDKKQSLSQALLLGGAAMMANGGPSEKPTNLLSIVGQGLGNGVGAYNANMDGIADRNTKGTANKVNQVKLQNAQNAQTRSSAFIEKYGSPSENGYSIEALFALHEMQLANGDDEGARLTQRQIQALQQHGADNGMVVSEDGFRLADGYQKSLFDTKKAESLGSAQGQNAQITADQKDYQFGKDNPEFRKYETEKKKDTNISVNTGPKDGDMWKALDKERENASGAQGALNQVHQMKHSLANATTGFAANQVLWGQKAIAALGGDSSKVADTETFRTQAMEMAARMKSELVGNAQISDSDMRFVQQVSGGDITLDKVTLEKLLDIREKSLNGTINRYNEKIDRIYPDTEENKTNRTYFGGIKAPENPYGKGAQTLVVDSEDAYGKVPAGAAYRFSDDPPDMVRRKR